MSACTPLSGASWPYSATDRKRPPGHLLKRPARPAVSFEPHDLAFAALPAAAATPSAYTSHINGDRLFEASFTTRLAGTLFGAHEAMSARGG
jgi:hypothetical protein